MTADAFDTDVGDVEPPGTDRSILDDVADARADAETAGFVAVGGRFDADLRYLTRFDGPEREYAFVRTGDERVLCAPAGYDERAARQFDGRVTTERAGTPAGKRAAAVLDAASSERTERAGPLVSVPATIPHDAAVYLEGAGYELRSTRAVKDARATKTDREVDAMCAVQAAAERGFRRGERLLATADVVDGALHREETPLTAERLRRRVNADLARRGVDAAGNTTVAVGTSPTTQPRDPSPSSIRRGETVCVTVAPRGPHGYHGTVARTFVLDSEGGWDRRAYVAVESALDAALDAIEPGIAAATVGREAAAEIAAFGFEPPADRDLPGVPELGHGVGLSRRESPSLRSDTQLETGMVVAVAPGVVDPDYGCVRLCDLAVVTAEGCERLGSGARSFSPRA